jgi:hypothetical protein
VRDRTLWEAVIEFVNAEGPVRRRRLLERFSRDDERAVLAVLSDLVRSGLLYSAGRGESTVYECTSDRARSELRDTDELEVIATLVWGTSFRHPGSRVADLPELTRLPEASTRAAVESLLADGRLIQEPDGRLSAAPFVIKSGAASGWEAAVFDHFQAMSSAIVHKLIQRTRPEEEAESTPTRDEVGGTTLHFGVHPDHPFEAEVRGTLGRIRRDLETLWQKVAEYNRQHPLDDEAATRITFYFGQIVKLPDAPAPALGSGPDQRSNLSPLE